MEGGNKTPSSECHPIQSYIWGLETGGQQVSKLRERVWEARSIGLTLVPVESGVKFQLTFLGAVSGQCPAAWKTPTPSKPHSLQASLVVESSLYGQSLPNKYQARSLMQVGCPVLPLDVHHFHVGWRCSEGGLPCGVSLGCKPTQQHKVQSRGEREGEILPV